MCNQERMSNAGTKLRDYFFFSLWTSSPEVADNSSMFVNTGMAQNFYHIYQARAATLFLHNCEGMVKH